MLCNEPFHPWQALADSHLRSVGEILEESRMASLIKDKLARGDLVHLFGMGQLLGPKLIELVAMRGGFDAIWIDQEHTGCGIREIEVASLACRAHALDSFVRLAPTDYATVMRPLEAGAGGIMAAQIRNAEDAQRVVQWSKYGPEGLRGITGSGVDAQFGWTPLPQYVEQANKDTFVAVQIETLEAVNHVDEIANVEGLDLLFVGPADLSQALGLTGQFDHSRCYETIEGIAAACRTAGKPWGIIARDRDYARRWVERGCRLLVFGDDLAVARLGIDAIKESFEGFF